ncbi:MAG TPA: hypothetical protein PLN06_00760 [Bacteroidales bacterium]|nr:ABC transporter permease [Bacteroidales bacterium]HOU95141.1 hypothetical protein [Bacteroidales bacterium]HQG37129.1 hypothetical protein [Bacteroidales bacterium]HQG53687.1 hypothetical protein [Bacteroidales bacterium]HQJ21300.1 hypothetical protein [Bacteroidales bacterium]
MKPKINLALKSLVYYKKQALHQAAIILILTAVITGSLLTGYSVRESLKNSAMNKIGNTGFIISSGLRYFNASISGKLESITGVECTSMLEMEGTAQKFNENGNGNRRQNIKIYGINHDFFYFHNLHDKYIGLGEAAVNEKFARALNLSIGDEIILNHKLIDDLPSGFPFAPSLGEVSTHVFKIKYILSERETGNFSLGISQIIPCNVFVDITELSRTKRANKILIDYKSNLNEEELTGKLKSILIPSDVGIKVRTNKATGLTEITSSRIFIDQSLIDEIRHVIPDAVPLITYLVNTTRKDEAVNPYSFASAVGKAIYKDIPEGNNILINSWLADDIGAKKGDTLILKWYDPERIKELVEKEDSFFVSGVVKIEDIWNDPELMPDFPGIAGKKSCTAWDAGVSIKTELIRKKDEDYWNKYQGTPKIFLNYEKGKEIWGSNFGQATAIRIASGAGKNEVIYALTGNINPGCLGFKAINIRNEMMKATAGSVDFGTLFLALGFFIIAACILLLILAINSYLEFHKEHIFSLFALGFKNKKIINILTTEHFIIGLTGAFTGAFAGMLFNLIIIKALNTVWQGAVNADMIIAYNGAMPIFTGFLSTLILSLLIQYNRTKKFLLKMSEKDGRQFRLPSKKTKLTTAFCLFFIISGILLSILNIFISTEPSLIISYISGTFLFAGLILLFYGLVVYYKPDNSSSGFIRNLSRSYYHFYPARAVLPVLLISAGLFALIITGANRLEITDKSTSTAGGTGGFLIWAETSTPVKENLNTPEGKKKFGLNNFPANEMIFVQARKLQGDDASCLNLNQVSSPPLLGIDNSYLAENKAFSFASLHPEANPSNPWEMIERSPGKNIIYGFADQTVLQWGLKKSVGDTLIYSTEQGENLYIIIAGGLKSSVFQGYIITGEKFFNEYFPSATGYSVFLIAGNSEHIENYLNILNSRFEAYGINAMSTKERLSAFFEVTNTYLSVFTVLGAFGMIMGIAGLGFVLRQNYNYRRRDFAMMLAVGFKEKRIKRMVISEQLIFLLSGVITGFIGALTATLPSLKEGVGMPWISTIIIIIILVLTGFFTLSTSLKGINKESLVTALRKE